MGNYSLELSVLYTKYKSENGLINVSEKINTELFDEVYKIAEYFKNELDYDTVPFCKFGSIPKPFEVILFTEKAYDKVDNQNPYSCRIYGACLFSSIKIEDKNHWKLEWIWLHPFFRHRGNLQKYWQDLEKRFDNFFIGKPISNDMKSFLTKCNSKHTEI